MTSTDDAMDFDYIVVGGGSAGCVLANRLSADGRFSVLLLEAGLDAEPFWVRTPAGVGSVFYDPRVNWKFSTEPEHHLADRRIYCPRGKVMGGSSAINGMLYMRGLAYDYDRWEALGNAGWSWEQVLPYFKRAESSDITVSRHRGAEGPLKVSFPRRQHPSTDAFVKAGVQAGVELSSDIAGEMQGGIGYAQHTVGDGLRSSTAKAYLALARSRTNLTVLGEALVAKVLLRDRRAFAVEFLHRGATRIASARREIVVSAGAIGSPQLLMLSGIGDPDHLRDKGVQVTHALPGVGANLQDHLAINAAYEVRQGYSLNAALSGWRKYVQGAAYLVHRGGPLAVGVTHAVAFVPSDSSVPAPDIQLSFRPMSLAFDSNKQLRMHPFPGVQIAGAMLRPKSRGRVLLNSREPSDAPKIHGNFLSNPDDEAVMVATLSWIRRIAGAKPLDDIVVRENLPSPGVRTRDEVLDFVRRSGETIYHPVGTCRMGQSDDAVVDERLLVRGLLGLRVVDASVMPEIVSGNTNAPTIMIAEKASDMILEDTHV